MHQHQTIFECSSCGAQHNTSSTALPVGWSAASGSAWCNDCTAAGIPARMIRPARKGTGKRLTRPATPDRRPPLGQSKLGAKGDISPVGPARKGGQ